MSVTDSPIVRRKLDYLEANIFRGKNEPGDVNINIYTKIQSENIINLELFRIHSHHLFLSSEV